LVVIERIRTRQAARDAAAEAERAQQAIIEQEAREKEAAELSAQQAIEAKQRDDNKSEEDKKKELRAKEDREAIEKYVRARKGTFSSISLTFHILHLLQYGWMCCHLIEREAAVVVPTPIVTPSSPQQVTNHIMLRMLFSNRDIV
jgi:hypothetical protein